MALSHHDERLYPQRVKHRFVDVSGINIFYREAGPPDAPALLLLPGFPSSSHQFRHVLPALADRWRIVAPDFPAFGFSACPDPRHYAYTFEHYTATTEAFTQALGLERYALYVHDYGAQVGFRLAMRAPERVGAFVIQNSEAYYADGRSPAWSAMETYWREASPRSRDALRNVLFSEEGIRREFLEHLPAKVAELIDPDTIWLAWTHINRPGVLNALLDLHLDYRVNVDLYPRYQAYFREYRPPALVIWGREDQYYTPAAAMAYRRDLPDAEIKIIGGGHWALESHGPEITELTREFLLRRWPSPT
jgi:pimeloyl-ACP methyl ester carboxylesterase